jgi:unsaturated rhamnogalacturonyl hydrolase
MKLFNLIALIFFGIGTVSAAEPVAVSFRTPHNEVIDVMRLVYRNQLSQPIYDDASGWKNAALFTGVMAAYEASKDTVCLDTARVWAEKFNWKLSDKITRNADYHCCGQSYLDLYILDSALSQRYANARETYDCIDSNFVNFTCDNISKDTWSWADSLFMAPPLLPRLSFVTGDSKYITIMNQMWMQTESCLYDSNEKLFYRDYSFFDLRTGGKKIFWSRANGWVMAGIVRILEFLPANDSSRSHYVNLLTNMASAVATLQGDDGFWRSNLLYPEQYPNPETSGTAFFCYAIAWGINHGYLSQNTYGPIVENAWQGLCNIAVHGDGRVGYVQEASDRPGSADYNDTELYGTGAFLLAASEMYKYYQSSLPDNIDCFEQYCGSNFFRSELSEFWKDGSANGSTASISLFGITNQAMQLTYNNSAVPYIAKASRSFTPAKNFNSDSHNVLSFYIKGAPVNGLASVYVSLKDSTGNISQQMFSDSSFILENKWFQLNFALSDFHNIDLNSIAEMTIGLGNGTYSAGANGKILIDELRLNDVVCLKDEVAGDLTKDCKVDFSDFAVIANSWLDIYYQSELPVVPDFSKRTCYYRFDETSGGMVIDSSNNYNNGVAYLTQWASQNGRSNGAINITGTSNVRSRVEVPASAFSAQAGTIAFWVYLNNNQTYATTRYIFGQNKPASSSVEWGRRMQLYLQDDNTLRLGLGGSHYLPPEIAILQIGQWTHIALTWSTGNYKVYVNGNLKSAGTFTGLDAFGTIHIGNNASLINPTQALNGMIDDFMVYSYALTVQEIMYLSESLPQMDNIEAGDLYADGAVNIRDMQMFIHYWLEGYIWP